MNNIRVAIFGLLYFAFFSGLLSACSGSERAAKRDLESREWVIRQIKGNQLILNGRTTLELAGIEDNPNVEAFLKQQFQTDALSEPIRIVLDNNNLPRRPSRADVLLGYASDATGKNINCLLLQREISQLDTSLSIDSSYAFQLCQDATLATSNTQETEGTSQFSVERLREACFQVKQVRANGQSVGIGSGFFLTESGIGVSNHHVLENGSAFVVKRCADGREFPIQRILVDDPQYDYTIFQVSGSESFTYLPMEEGQVEQGDPIYVYGTPRDLSCSLTRGIVSALRGPQQERIQIDAAISPGNSGSAVVNEAGRVIGIATFKRRECENCNFAMNIGLIKPHIP